MADRLHHACDPRGCGEAITRRGFMIAGSCTLSALVAAFSDLTPIAASAATPQERTYPVPAADGVSIDRDAQVILVRQQQNVYAFNLSCPHQNAAVRWVADGTRFQCSRHDSRYSADGTHTAGRATRNMDRFPIRRDGPAVIVDVSRIIRSDQDPGGWAAAAVRVG